VVRKHDPFDTKFGRTINCKEREKQKARKKEDTIHDRYFFSFFLLLLLLLLLIIIIIYIFCLHVCW
jgi:hypothetical protein